MLIFHALASCGGISFVVLKCVDKGFQRHVDHLLCSGRGRLDIRCDCSIGGSLISREGMLIVSGEFPRRNKSSR